jgi:ferredoxin like protein
MENIPKEKKKMSLEDKLALVKTKKDTVSHITVDLDKCVVCKNKVCLFICPAKTYEEIDGKLVVNYENCLECGTCRIVCEDGVIQWENPRGKFGVTFLNG